MARRLPEDPSRRRLAYLKKIYQHLPHWRSLREQGVMDDIITIPETGEEIYAGDLLIGLDSLPPRQRQAFELICLQGFTETAATKIMLPDSKWSTPIQQYADTALQRMVASYDAKQQGTWQKPTINKKQEAKTLVKKKGKSIMGDVSFILKNHLNAALAELSTQRELISQEISKVESLLEGAMS